MPKEVTQTTKVIALVALVFIVSACGKPLTNEEIIQQSNVCKQAGLKVGALHESFFHMNNITGIVCQP